MKRKWNQSYKKGLRNSLVSMNAVCEHNQLIMTVEYGGYNLQSNIIKLDLDTKEYSTLLTESCTVRVLLKEDNRIYFSTFAGDAYCMDLDGNIIWKTDIGERNASFEVVIDEERIYFYDYTLYCLNKRNGEILWTNDCEKNKANCPFVISEKYIYHGESNGKIRCINKLTGEQVWEYGYNMYTYYCELVDNKLVTFQSVGSVIILDAENGKQLVKRKLVNGYIQNKPLFYENKLFVEYADNVRSATEGELVCFSYDEDFNFEKEYGIKVDSDFSSNIFVDKDRVMFATKNENLYLLENKDGEQTQTILKTKGAARYILEHEGFMYVISDKGQVECYQ